jgi:hypothetical protein
MFGILSHSLFRQFILFFLIDYLSLYSLSLLSPLRNSLLAQYRTYRPSVNHPNLSQTEQFSQSMELLISSSNNNVHILGDLNINILKYSSLNVATEYIDFLFFFGCLQVITWPTRCNPTCATLIDHVISNSICANISSFILTSLILDHFPIIHHCNKKRTA